MCVWRAAGVVGHMCTAAIDDLGLPFTCALADGRPMGLSLPSPAAHARASKSAARALEWRDVAAGMMLNTGPPRERRAGGRAGRQVTLRY